MEIHFTLVKKNEINIYVYGGLDLYIRLSLILKGLSEFSSKPCFLIQHTLWLISIISYNMLCVTIATSLIDMNTYFQWCSTVA